MLRAPNHATAVSNALLPCRGPRPGEALQFNTPLKGGRSPAVVLQGLRLFLAERFGGARQAFERMDFHRDGRVSCLEFQEVLSGQERYCGLQEARELFCLLARGTDGWLTWQDFSARLGRGGTDLSQRHGGLQVDMESGGTWSCGSSESSRLASHALRALVFGPGSKRDEAETEADDVATTVQTLTSRSSQSCPQAAAGRSAVLLGPSLRCASNVSGAASPSFASWAQRLHTDGEAQTQTRGAADELARKLFEGAVEESSCAQRFQLRAVSSSEPFSSSHALPASSAEWAGPCHGAAAAEAAAAAAAAVAPGAALNCLDHSLQVLRTEVAALAALQAASGGVPVGLAAVRVSHPFHPPGGLVWVCQLPVQLQGRLAGCSAPSEALDILEEAIAALPSIGFSATASVGMGTLGAAGAKKPPGPGRWRSRPTSKLQYHDCSPGNKVEPALVEAAVGLMAAARSRVADLEAELKTRRRQQEEELAELSRRLRDDRRRALRRLLDRLAPPSAPSIRAATPVLDRTSLQSSSEGPACEQRMCQSAEPAPAADLVATGVASMSAALRNPPVHSTIRGELARLGMASRSRTACIGVASRTTSGSDPGEPRTVPQ